MKPEHKAGVYVFFSQVIARKIDGIKCISIYEDLEQVVDSRRFKARSAKQTPYVTREDQHKNTSYLQEYLVSSDCIISINNCHFILIGRLTNFHWKPLNSRLSSCDDDIAEPLYIWHTFLLIFLSLILYIVLHT